MAGIEWKVVHLPSYTAQFSDGVVLLSAVTSVSPMDDPEQVCLFLLLIDCSDTYGKCIARHWKWIALCSLAPCLLVSIPMHFLLSKHFQSQDGSALIARVGNVRKGEESGCMTPGYCFDLRLVAPDCQLDEQGGDQVTEQPIAFIFSAPGIYSFPWYNETSDGETEVMTVNVEHYVDLYGVVKPISLGSVIVIVCLFFF